MLAKVLDARDVYESKGVDAALKYLSKLPNMLASLGVKDVIGKGASALANPGFYRELGQNPEQLIAAARDAVTRLCYPPPVSEETTMPTPTTAAAAPAAESNGTPAKPKAKPAAGKKPTAKAKPEAATGDKGIRWSDKKIALLAALKKAGAINAGTGIMPEKIAKISGGKALTTLNPSFDVTAQGYIAVASQEGGPMVRYITPKGLKMLESLTAKPAK